MADLHGKKVAIIAVDFVEDAELTTPRDRLREAGADVKVYSPDGSPIQAVEGDTEPTQKIDADGSLDDIDVETIDALVVPGGTVNADKLRVDQTAQALVRQVAGAGKPLAVICHGPWLLVSAGLVKGRKLTSWPSLQDDIRNAGGEWVDEQVVRDGNLVTSRKPADIPAFNKAVCELIAQRRHASA